MQNICKGRIIKKVWIFVVRIVFIIIIDGIKVVAVKDTHLPYQRGF